MSEKKPEAGETWYIKRPNAITLIEVYIVKITEKVVIVMVQQFSPTHEVYELESIKFIEKIE